MEHNISKNKGLLYILLSTIMFGSYGLWSKLIGNDFGIFYQGWTRTFLISIILFPIVFYRKEIVSIEKKDWKWMSVFLISTSLTQAPIFYAFNHMDIGTATLLFFVGMTVMMYIVGFLFLGEEITKIKILAFFIACVGLYITFSFSLITFSLLAASMALLNGVATGIELSSSKKLTVKYSPLYVTWLSWVIIAITNFIASVVLGEVQYVPTLSFAWLYLIAYAVVSILGFWSVVQGYKYVESSVGSLLGLLEVVFAIIFGILFFHQTLTSLIIVGGALIIVSAALPHIAQFDIFKKIIRKY
ncbi:MAG: DMT family transporter [Candidatus Pacebacteria bacterium]|nr:DMT family transporter [Candidatus Paceibacterota bacterium]